MHEAPSVRTGLAARGDDLVLGVDFRLVLQGSSDDPTLALAGMPFVGIVFHPLALARDFLVPGALANAEEPAKGAGIVVVNGRMGATTADAALAVTPDAAGGGPGLIDASDADAELWVGSASLRLMGACAVRFGDRAYGRSDPFRLPSSQVFARCDGFPVLFGGLAKVDGHALPTWGLGGVAKWGYRGAGRLFSRTNILPPRTRWRGPTTRAARRQARADPAWVAALTVARAGPGTVATSPPSADAVRTAGRVDLYTGAVVIRQVDVSLPEPVPMAFTRVYRSIAASRLSSIGFGWTHPFAQAVRRGRRQLRWTDAEGRDVVFDLGAQLSGQLQDGDSVYHPLERCTLLATGKGHYVIETARGWRHRFVPVGTTEESVLARIETPSGYAVDVERDDQGHLQALVHGGGRRVEFEVDANGHLLRVFAPSSAGEALEERARYEYDEQGDLVGVRDACGAWTRYEYRQHLLVRESDRTGFDRFYQFNGFSPRSRCVRVWGDGGKPDHVIDYAPGSALVSDSLGSVTTYRFDAGGRLVGAIDAEGGTRRYEYENEFGWRRAEVDPGGAETRFTYDARGNVIAVARADGTETIARSDGNQAVEGRDVLDNKAMVRFDDAHRPVEFIGPTGHRTRYTYGHHGLLERVEGDATYSTELEYDEQRQCSVIRARDRGVTIDERYRFDSEGRLLEHTHVSGAITRWRRDPVGRVTERQRHGQRERWRYDREGRTVEWTDGSRRVRFGYSREGTLAYRQDGEDETFYEYDAEGRMLAVGDARGRRRRLRRNRCGLVVRDRCADGVEWGYQRDEVGRIRRAHAPDGGQTRFWYDEAGRLSRVQYDDSSEAVYRYRADGALLEARNDVATVRFDRDRVGRVEREWLEDSSGSGCGTVGGWVASERSNAELRTRVRSSEGLDVLLGRGPFGHLETVKVESSTALCASVTFRRDLAGLELAREFAGARLAWGRGSRGLAESRELASFGRRAERELYRWRSDGQLAARTRGDVEESLEYDERGRLVAQRVDGKPTDVRILDADGNAYRREDRRDRRYRRGGRLEQSEVGRFHWDEFGRLVSVERKEGVSTNLAWGADGFLRKVDLGSTEVSFEYDALGRRTGKIVRQRVPDRPSILLRQVTWIWDCDRPIHEIVDERQVDGSPRRTVITWVFEEARPTPLLRIGSGQTFAVFPDVIGAPAELVDEAGRVVWTVELDLFGEAVRRPSDAAVTVLDNDYDVSCDFRRPGHIADPDTGFVHAAGRWYWPRAGTYLSPALEVDLDSSRQAGGVTPPEPMPRYGLASDPRRASVPRAVPLRHFVAVPEEPVKSRRDRCAGGFPETVLRRNRDGGSPMVRVLNSA